MHDFSFSCLIALDRTSSTMLKKSGKRGHFGLFPDLRGKDFNFSILSMMLAVCLSYMAFIMLRYGPSIPNLLRVFFIMKCQILLNTLSAFIEIIVLFLSFILLM